MHCTTTALHSSDPRSLSALHDLLRWLSPATASGVNRQFLSLSSTGNSLWPVLNGRQHGDDWHPLKLTQSRPEVFSHKLGLHLQPTVSVLSLGNFLSNKNFCSVCVSLWSPLSGRRPQPILEENHNWHLYRSRLQQSEMAFMKSLLPHHPPVTLAASSCLRFWFPRSDSHICSFSPKLQIFPRLRPDTSKRAKEISRTKIIAET